MVRHLRLGIVTSSVTALLLAALLALALGTGTKRVSVRTTPAAASHRVVSGAGDSITPATTAPPTTEAPTTSTTAVPDAVAPTTVAPTVPPAKAPTTAASPAPTNAPVARHVLATPAAPVSSATVGSASDYTLLGYRWNPCRVITVNSTGPDVSGIVSELAAITGLHVQMVSGTAAINVSYGSVTPTPSGEVGLTNWMAIGGWLTGATIVIGHGADPYLATVLHHEMAHALGLGHAHHPNEVMYATVGASSPTDYQAGDLAGLRAVGASRGC